MPVDQYGRIDLDRYAAEIEVPGTLLASVQHANHELGTMQQVAEAARLAREAKVRFHTDACQTVGRLPVDAEALGVDLLSCSAHSSGVHRGRRALRPSRRGTHRVSVRRRPRAQATVGHGEHAGYRRDGGGPAGVARHDGRYGGPTVGPDGQAPRTHRRDRCRCDRARPPPRLAAPRLLQRGRRRRADPDDGPRRPGFRRRRIPVLRSARRRLTGARAHRTAGREQLPWARAEQHRGRRRGHPRRVAGLGAGAPRRCGPLEDALARFRAKPTR